MPSVTFIISLFMFYFCFSDSAKQANVKALAGELSKNVEAQQKKLDAKTTVENKEAHAFTPPGQSNVEHSKAKVSEDAHVRDPAVGTSAVAAAEKSKEPAEVPAPNTVQLKPKEEPENATNLDHPGIKSVPQPAKENCKTLPAKQVAAETVEAEAKVMVNSSPETPAVNNAKPKENAAPQAVTDTVSKSPNQSADGHVKDPIAGTSAVAGMKKNKDPAEVPAQAAVKLKPEQPPTVTEPENATNLDHAGVKSMAPPARESCETFPPKQVAAEAVKAEAKVVVNSSPETPAINNATPEGRAALQHSVEPVSDNVSKSPTQSAADTAVESAESKVNSEAPAESVVKTRAEEVVECEAPPGKNTNVKQSMDPVPENASSHVMELNIKDAVEPVTGSEDRAAQDTFSDRAIELTDALDGPPPTAESVPKPVNNPEQSHSERSKLNQCDETNK